MPNPSLLRLCALGAIIVGVWIALFPFERPVPAGRPEVGTPLILETTPTIDCGATIARINDTERHDGECRDIARFRLGVSVVFIAAGAVALVALREDADAATV